MNDETLCCIDCSEPVGLIRVMRGYLRLGHLRQPSQLHPVRLVASKGEYHPAAPRGQAARDATF